MKIARNSRLSLRKLFLAMLAVGPLAVLPSPVWAVLPTAGSYAPGTTPANGSFTVLNGSVVVSNNPGNTISDITFTDRAILSWGTTTGTLAVPYQGISDGTSITNFNIASTETYNFASAGAVLNKVVAGSNTTNTAFNGLGATAAIINGSLSGSSARVFILANGNITVGSGAQIRTQSLTLSTLLESNDEIFKALGDLSAVTAASPTSTGSISFSSIPTLPGANAGASASGNLTLAAGSIGNLGASTVGGDLIVRSVTSGSAVNLAGSTVALDVTGNLSVTTNSGAITQTNGLTVGASTATVNQTAAFNSGTAAVTLANNANNFEVVTAQTSGATGSVTVRDANIVTLGASNIGGDLSVTAGGRTDTTAIATNGTLVIGGNATFISATSANSSVSIGNNSTIAGFVTGATAGGAVTINTVGALNLGNITTNLTATDLTGVAFAALAATTSPLGAGGTVTGATITAGATSPIYTGNVTATFTSPIASANAVVGVSTIAVSNGGVGYTSVPAVTFAAPPTGGTAPTATAVVTNGVVTGITVLTAGVGYTSVPSVTIAAAPSGGTTASASVGSVTLQGITGLSGGSGYAGAPTITIVGGGNTGATATATLTGDQVSAIALGGTLTGYTSAPSIIVAPPVVGAAAAQGTAVRDTTTGLITSINITNAGLGYGASLPTITFPAVTADTNFSSGGITANTTGALTTSIAGLATLPGAAPALPISAGLKSGAGISLTGTTIATNAPVTARSSSNSTTSFTATAGGITFGDVVSANRISANTAAAGGAITQLTTTTPSGAAAATITSGSNATSGSTLNAGNGTITLDGAANSWSNNSPITITAGNVGLRSVNNITTSTINVTGNASLVARPATAGNRSVTLGTGDGVGQGDSITVGGILSVTANSAGSINDNNYSVIRATGGLNLAVTAGTDATPTVGSGSITFDAASVAGTRAEFGQVNASTTGAVTIAETTTLNLGNIGTAASPVASLRATSINGGIIDTGNIFVATSGNATFVLSGNNTAVIDGTSNVLPTINIIGGGDSSVTGVNSNLVLGNATSIFAGNVTLGTNSGFPITLGSFDITGSLTVNSGSWIDIAGTANVTGNLALNATGNIANAATLTGTGAGPAFSTFMVPTVTINNTTGAVTALGGSNFPLLSFAAAPTVTLVGGSLPTTGATAGAVSLNTSGGVTAIAAPVGAAQGTGYVIPPVVTITGGGGSGATAVAVLTGDKVTSFQITNAGTGYAATPTITLAGGGAPTTAASVTSNINSAGEITGFTVANGGGGLLPYNSAFAPRIDITGATTTSITETTGVLRVSGTTSISSPGNALLFRGNDFNAVVLNNSTGGAVVNDVNNLTISGNSGGAVIARAGASGTGTIGTAVTNAPASIASAYQLTLGNLNVNSLVAASQNGGGGDSGTLTQIAGTSIHSENLARFETTNANIVIGNNGNSFGRVELNVGSTDGSRTVTLVEDGTIKLGNLSSRGTSTLTSRFGSIIEDSANDVVISQNGTLVANSANGSILIGNTTHTAGVTTANIVTFNGTAPTGQIAVTSNNSTTLGTINANSLNVSVTGGNGNITQTNALRVFGTSNFSATRNITLTNNGNNFGRVFLSTTNASRDIAITEGGTLNLGGVTMGFGGDATTAPSSTGNFTATSVNGDIIDSGLGGVKLGGRIAAAGVVSPTAPATTPPTLTTGAINVVGTGVVTLNAVNGNITLDDPTTDFFTTGGVAFNAKNVTLSPLGTTAVYLGTAGSTSTVTGNLTVTSATGSIFNAGALQVSGDAFFQSGSGDIIVTNAGNNFDTVRFAGKVVSITEAGNMTILTGSSATDAATFVSNGGSITIANRGGIVTLAKTGFFSASAGAITLPKLIQAGDTLTVTASGTKDLSALSITSDLGGKTPINLGAGTYLPPQP